MDLRFADHRSFHRAAAGMVGGALVFGAALQPVTPFAPIAGGALGIAAGAAIGHGKATGRMLIAGVALALLLALAPSWPALVAVAAVMSLALALGGPRGVRGIVGALIGALAVLVAAWCAIRIGRAHATAHWPAMVTAAVAAAAMGAVGVLALVPRHLAFAIDPVKAAYQRLPADLDGEVRGLCSRAVGIWTAVRERVADEAGVALVRDGVIKTLEVAARSADVKLTGASDAELAARMAELDQRISGATDGEARVQYQSARAQLDDQQRYRGRILQGRERLIARMHNHVAALEKFELVATGLAAARAASADSSTIHQLEELSHGVAASGEALAEIELS